ncbi:uncharacterized protein VTP21DRAFT_507 [Calcarisporiella thermophila]|uniref:uncharacterized protein n=1 Tax=Calcarisporiella thermophila TaxID=911321 RepID=UPI003743883E
MANIKKYIIPAHSRTNISGARLVVNRHFIESQTQKPVVGIIFSHANGFCKEIWWPIINRLFDHFQGTIECWAMDCRHQGESGVLNQKLLAGNVSWLDCGRDILQLISFFQMRKRYQRIIGIGHSFGGTCSLMAQILLPNKTFDAIFLIDPVLAKFERNIKGGLLFGVQAYRRRDEWENIEEAKKYHRGKEFFAAFDPEVFELYMKYGLYELPNSKMVALKTTTEQEALTFICDTPSHFTTFKNLRRIRVPTFWITGANSIVCPKAEVPALAKLCPGGGEYHIVKNAGHMVSLEKPKEVSEVIIKYLEQYKLAVASVSKL